MKKNENNRYRVERKFIEDKFFSKGFLWNKVYTTILTIIGWLAVGTPIYWTVTSTLWRDNGIVLPMWSYADGIRLYFLMDKWLIISYVLLMISALLLTLYNNYKTKYKIKKKVLYNKAKLAKREEILEKLYEERFGVQRERQIVRYYDVPEEKNLTVDLIQSAYEKEDVNI